MVGLGWVGWIGLVGLDWSEAQWSGGLRRRRHGGVPVKQEPHLGCGEQQQRTNWLSLLEALGGSAELPLSQELQIFRDSVGARVDELEEIMRVTIHLAFKQTGISPAGSWPLERK